jgi:hypothetical protein
MRDLAQECYRLVMVGGTHAAILKEAADLAEHPALGRPAIA